MLPSWRRFVFRLVSESVPLRTVYWCVLRQNWFCEASTRESSSCLSPCLLHIACFFVHIFLQLSKEALATRLFPLVACERPDEAVQITDLLKDRLVTDALLVSVPS